MECQVLERADGRLVIVPALFQLSSEVTRQGPYRSRGCHELDPLLLSAEAMRQLAQRDYAVLGADDTERLRLSVGVADEGLPT